MTGDPSMPDFAVIGAMKCSTSTLHDQLNLQPGISTLREGLIGINRSLH
jgi:hypothetical protein